LGVERRRRGGQLAVLDVFAPNASVGADDGDAAGRRLFIY
jgi:hypothetical protein